MSDEQITKDSEYDGDELLGVFFIIDGNRRWAKRELLAELYEHYPTFYDQLSLHSNMPKSVHNRIKNYVENRVDFVPQPDNLSFNIPNISFIQDRYYNQYIAK